MTSHMLCDNIDVNQLDILDDDKNEIDDEIGESFQQELEEMFGDTLLADGSKKKLPNTIRYLEEDEDEETVQKFSTYDPFPTVFSLPYTMGPDGDELEIEIVKNLDSIPREDWFRDSDHGITFTVSRFNEPFSVAALHTIRKYPDSVWFKIYDGTKLLFTGNFVDAILTCGWDWVCSRQRVILQSDYLDHKLETSPLAKPKPSSKKVSIYFVAHGPTLPEIETYGGVGGEHLCTVGDTNFYFSNESTGETVHVPASLKYAWLERVVGGKILSYSDKKTYEHDLDAYSMRTFTVHQQQLRSLLGGLKPELTVVAPADGVGLVARTWTGDKICGDLNRTEMTADTVREETIKSTLLRAESVKGKKLYVFSYCDEYLTDKLFSALDFVGASMVFFTANREIEKRKFGLQRQSPGVYVKHFQLDLLIVNNDHKEKGDRILFSENFLQIKPIFHNTGTYMDYYQRMNPLGCYSVVEELRTSTYFTGGGDTHVAETIEDWLTLVKKGPTYLTLIGRIVTTREEMPVLAMGSVIQSRTLYLASDPEDAYKKCPHSQYFQRGKEGYFCTWSDDTTFTVNYVERQVHMDDTHSRRKKEEKPVTVLKNFTVRVSQKRLTNPTVEYTIRGLEITLHKGSLTEVLDLRCEVTAKELEGFQMALGLGEVDYVLTGIKTYMASSVAVLGTYDGLRKCRRRKGKKMVEEFVYKGKIVRYVRDVIT